MLLILWLLLLLLLLLLHVAAATAAVDPSANDCLTNSFDFSADVARVDAVQAVDAIDVMVGGGCCC